MTETVKNHGRKYAANQQSMWIGLYMFTGCLVGAIWQPAFAPYAALLLGAGAGVIVAKDTPHAIGNAMAKKNESKTS